MNTYLIITFDHTPYNPKAESVTQAIEQAGLEIEQVASVEVMIPDKMPPNNWQDVTPPKRKKLTTEDKLREEIAELKRKIAEIEGKK